MEKTPKRDTEIAARVHKVARITGVKTIMIYKVLRGKRKNDLVLTTYMELLKKDQELENKLAEAQSKILDNI